MCAKKRTIILFLFVVLNIMISFLIHPVEDQLISENILEADTFYAGTDSYVDEEENQIVFKETPQTDLAYTILNIKEYDYLQINFEIQPLKGSCRVFADIGGDNTNLSNTERFFSQFYVDVDDAHTYMSGRLELDRNHSETGMFRILNDAGAPMIVRNVKVSGWKFYKLSNYSMIMLLLFSVFIACVIRRWIMCNSSIFGGLVETFLVFTSINGLLGGLGTKIAEASNSLSNIVYVIYEFLVSESQYTWMITVCFIFCFYVVMQIRKHILHKYSVIASYVFACFLLSGYMYDTCNVFFELYHQKYFWMECLWLVTGLALAVQCVMKILHIFMQYVISHSKTYMYTRRKCFLTVWVIITTGWSLHLLIRYPAAIHWDATAQINGVLQDSLDTFHPVFSSLLMGGAAKLGNIVFGSFNIGIFLYIVLQMILCSVIFAYGISLLTKFHVSRTYVWVTTFICSCMPVFSSFTTSVSKDVPFSNLVMLFLMLLFECLQVKSDISFRFEILFVVVSMSVFLLSNKGIFYVFVSTIGMIIFGVMKREKKYWKLSAVLMVSLLVSQFIQTSLNNKYGDISHLNVTICQPLQEIGYYTLRYADEWSKEDKELIDRYVVYENIAESYTMDMADGMFYDVWRPENEHSIKEICQLAFLWCKGFMKHPDCYIDATLRCNYGFYYPDTKQWGDFNSGYYIGTPDVPGIELPFQYSERLQNLNKKLSKLILLIENIPVLYVFNSIAISVWIQIFICIYLFFQKKWEEWFCVLVSLVSFALCLIGPTYYCGGARYALVSVFFNIFLVGYWINDRYKENGQ